MRIFLPVLFFFGVSLFVVHAFVLATDYSGIAQTTTCDLCGGCTDASGKQSTPGDWKACRACLYDKTDNKPLSGKSWTPIGCIETQSGSFIQTILRFIIGIAGGMAFLGILWGGFQLVTAAGDPIRISSGKNTIVGSCGALLLILFSAFLLQFVGITILGLPGFGG